MTPIFAITEQYKYRRRVLSYACLFLLLVCFADNSIAQSPTAPTVSISLDQPNATVWEGGTIRFSVNINRPLEMNEQLSVSLKYSTRISVPTQGASVSQVSGDGLNNGVTLADLDVEVVGGTTTFQTTATFVAGAQTATLQWKFGNDNVLREDRNAEIVIDRIESNISPTPIADPDNDTLAVTVWEDEYRIRYERNSYVLQEEDMGGELKLIISGGDRVTNFGLQRTTRVMFTYLNFTAGDLDDRVIDYVAVDSLTIPPNTTSSLVEIKIVNDQFLEINELFRITINPENLPAGLRASHTDIIIVDDDDIRVNITARKSSAIAGSPAIFTITRTPPLVAPNDSSEADFISRVSISTTLTMTLEVIEINDEGINYAPSISMTTSALEPSAARTTATITIPPGRTMATYSIPTVDDGVSKSRSELRVRISEGTLAPGIPRPPVFRAILGDSGEASFSVLSPRLVYIRLKVFLEGPLQ